jgi:sec-independent protein translocase protein TatA
MFDMLAYGGNPTLWIAVVVIVVLLFGANRIPEMFRGLGSGMREFKKGLNDDSDDENKTGNPPAATKV